MIHTQLDLKHKLTVVPCIVLKDRDIGQRFYCCFHSKPVANVFETLASSPQTLNTAQYKHCTSHNHEKISWQKLDHWQQSSFVTVWAYVCYSSYCALLVNQCNHFTQNMFLESSITDFSCAVHRYKCRWCSLWSKHLSAHNCNWWVLFGYPSSRSCGKTTNRDNARLLWDCHHK